MGQREHHKEESGERGARALQRDALYPVAESSAEQAFEVTVQARERTLGNQKGRQGLDLGAGRRFSFYQPIWKISNIWGFGRALMKVLLW
jgi:hypothetical protein